jgi:uncharacterized SAM-binding protein YcdF (DUF218 family)
MFFFLSKTISYLAQPFTIICFLLIVAAIVKNTRLKKKLFTTGLILLLFFSNDFIANEFMLAWEVKATPYNVMHPYKVGIVLTGATIPLLKPNDRVYFQRGADRVYHTVQLFKLGLIEKILISGGSGRLTREDEPEADQFQKAMVIMGVPVENIIIENETRNTAESAREVKKLIEKAGYRGTDCLLITSAFHMRRSLACYRKAGLEPDPFSTDFFAHPRNFFPDTLILPNIDALNKWHKLFREWVGFIAYKFAGYV